MSIDVAVSVERGVSMKQSIFLAIMAGLLTSQIFFIIYHQRLIKNFETNQQEQQTKFYNFVETICANGVYSMRYENNIMEATCNE